MENRRLALAMTDKPSEPGKLGMLQTETNGVESGEIQTEMMHHSSVTQISEAPACAKKPKKKKKKEVERKDGQQKATESTTEGTSVQESTQLTPEEQLSRELDWCTEQLELGLRTQKTSSKQREEASRALKTLRSSKAPLVKKRQVMRAISGDYRRKMEEDRARQFKQIQSAVTSARVNSVSECKAVFHRRAERTTLPTNKTANTQETNEHTGSVEETQRDTKPFVFTKTQEEFLFNFKL